MTMTLTISGRALGQHVSYINPIKSFSLNKEEQSKTDFLMKELKKEVKNLDEKGKKIILKTLKLMYLTSTSTLGVMAISTSQVFAQSSLDAAFIPKSEILEIFAYLTGITALIGVGASILLLQSAGIYRMFKKKKESIEWTSDILKGLTQVIASPILVGVIAVLAYMLFGNSEWFIKPY